MTELNPEAAEQLAGLVAPVADAPPGSSDRPAAPAAGEGQAPAGDKPPKRRNRKGEPSGAAKRKAKRAAASSPPAGSSSGAALTAELRKLEQQLEALLVAPAVPMNMAGDAWPAAHVEQRGPALAHQVIELARRNPAFRAQLQRAFAVTEGGQLAFAAAAYLAPVLIYYGLIPTPPIVKAQLGVPDRAEAREVVHAPPVGSNGGPPPDPHFREQPPGTAGAPPSAAPGAAAPG